MLVDSFKVKTNSSKCYLEIFSRVKLVGTLDRNIVVRCAMLAACTMKGGSFLSSFFRYYSPLAKRNNGILLEVFQFPFEKLPLEKTSHFP